jgi:hypothetical protein
VDSSICIVRRPFPPVKGNIFQTWSSITHKPFAGPCFDVALTGGPSRILTPVAIFLTFNNPCIGDTERSGRAVEDGHVITNSAFIEQVISPVSSFSGGKGKPLFWPSLEFAISQLNPRQSPCGPCLLLKQLHCSQHCLNNIPSNAEKPWSDVN